MDWVSLVFTTQAYPVRVIIESETSGTSDGCRSEPEGRGPLFGFPTATFRVPYNHLSTTADTFSTAF